VSSVDPVAAGFSVVILSRDAANLVPCVRAVLANEPELPPERIIVVDDGARAQAEPLLPPIRWIEGVKPFVFARNANLGIAGAPDAAILLNDDALLLTPRGLTSLARAGAQHPEFGAISAVTNVAGNPAQQPANSGLREDPSIAFVCALIPRSTWDRVGPLDERYCLDYGVEDRDYCHRILQAGLKVGIYDFCFVDHAYLRSSFRGDPSAGHSFALNYALFKEKWGLP
jgi:GT2 family glycosyltransferase